MDLSYAGRVPRYEYRCRDCQVTFELSRPMSAATAAAPCPHGHTDTVKLLSTVAVTRAGGAPAPARGGCCGGACGCS